MEGKLEWKAFQQSPWCYGIVREVEHSSRELLCRALTSKEGRGGEGKMKL